MVAQLPAFLVALAAGLIVTRTSVDSDLSRDTVTQIFQHSRVLYITAVALSVLAFTGLPLLPMLTFAIGCAGLGWLIDETQSAPSPTVVRFRLRASRSPRPRRPDRS